MRARFTISLLSLISFISLRSYLFNLHRRFLFNLHCRFLFNLSPSLVLGYTHLRSLISDIRSQPFNLSSSLLSDLRSFVDVAHCHQFTTLLHAAEFVVAANGSSSPLLLSFFENAPDAAVIAKCQMPKLFNTLTAEGNTTRFDHTICSPSVQH
ncbi:uncharacterized protein [Arachis hypogaea]|uniref:uncharacterized protein isoform X1 n=1 Tax=Arachis hypogaea TaxID=3818 RepID=UPI003B22622D